MSRRMFRVTTVNELERIRALDDTPAEFVMDEDAFRGFYDRTARGLWAYLARITGDRQLADDLLQETFYRFLRAAAVHENEAHRRNSLYRIATNLSRDAHRRSTPAAAGDEIETVASGEASESPERMADFSRALSSLKPREREMLWLAYAEGATHQEIAETLGLRQSSLKPLLFRARRKMAALLGGRA